MAHRQHPPSYLDQTPKWPGGYSAWLPERIPPVRRVGYTLIDLMRRGLLPPGKVAAFQRATLLQDFAWRVLWADTDAKPDAESVADTLCHADGLVVFVHGWAGSGEIWEDLPALVIKRNPRLVALVPDVNGFGGSPFSMSLPPIEKCDPPANMRAIELWLDLIGVRAKASWPQRRPLVFVGHSMGGATLFFLNGKTRRKEEIGRIALAPALLMNDRQRQVFYRTIGTGIRLSGLSDGLDRLVENFIAPRFIEMVAGSGSLKVRAQHKRIFDTTPEGVIAQTFAAMGRLNADFKHSQWRNFAVFLAEKDLLVGLKPTSELLERIRFQPEQVRQVSGDHYFFSVGSHADNAHIHNRELVIGEILAMHVRMMNRLKKKPARMKPGRKSR